MAVVLLPIISTAATTQFDTGSANSTQFDTGNSNSTEFDTGSSGNCGNTDPNALQNPLNVCSIQDLIVLLVNTAVVIGIPIAVLFIVYAGFKFIMARGSPTGLSEARANLVATLIGVAIFVGASLIAEVIINTLHQLGAATELR